MYFDAILGDDERNRIQIHYARTRRKGRKRHGLWRVQSYFHSAKIMARIPIPLYEDFITFLEDSQPFLRHNLR